jgi:hypothetical protein
VNRRADHDGFIIDPDRMEGVAGVERGPADEGPAGIIAILIGHAKDGSADGPATLLAQESAVGGTLRFEQLAGDWNGDGSDTLGVAGDFTEDGDVDGADFL